MHYKFGINDHLWSSINIIYFLGYIFMFLFHRYECFRNIKIPFFKYVILWRRILFQHYNYNSLYVYNIYPVYGVQNQMNIFPKKKPIIHSWVQQCFALIFIFPGNAFLFHCWSYLFRSYVIQILSGYNYLASYQQMAQETIHGTFIQNTTRSGFHLNT